MTFSDWLFSMRVSGLFLGKSIDIGTQGTKKVQMLH